MGYKSDGFRDLNVSTWWDTATRYQQIKRYASRTGLKHWVAIDDDPEGWNDSDMDKLVHTNGDTGLSDTGAQALLKARLDYLNKAAR